MYREVPPILIASCGNPDAGGDAFGPMVTAALRRLEPDAIRIADLGMRPAALLDHLEGISGLIIVDAVHVPGERVGRLIDVDWFDADRPKLAHDDPMSTHGLSIGRQLELAQRLSLLPRHVRLIGCVIDPAPAIPRETQDLPPQVTKQQVALAVHQSLQHRARWLHVRFTEANHA